MKTLLWFCRDEDMCLRMALHAFSKLHEDMRSLSPSDLGSVGSSLKSPIMRERLPSEWTF